MGKSFRQGEYTNKYKEKEWIRKNRKQKKQFEDKKNKDKRSDFEDRI